MTQPVFLMVEATPNPAEMAAMQSYLSKAPVITKEHGGVPVATYDVASVLDNNAKPAVFAVISFPSKEAIDNLFSDPAYEALVAERDRGFSHLRYYIVNERL
ncbi:MAG: DUF1330 domain-containing protein [Bermanella sp.]